MLRSRFDGTESRKVSLCFAFGGSGAKNIQEEFLQLDQLGGRRGQRTK